MGPSESGATTRVYRVKTGTTANYQRTPRDHFCDRTGPRKVASAHFRRMRDAAVRVSSKPGSRSSNAGAPRRRFPEPRARRVDTVAL